MSRMLKRLARMSDEELRTLERMPERLRAWAIKEDEAAEERARAASEKEERAAGMRKLLDELNKYARPTDWTNMIMIKRYLGISRARLNSMMKRQGLSNVFVQRFNRNLYWIRIDDLLKALGLTPDDLVERR